MNSSSHHSRSGGESRLISSQRSLTKATQLEFDAESLWVIIAHNAALTKRSLLSTRWAAMIGAILISASGRFRTALIPVRPGVVLTQKPANGLADPVDLMACEAARDIFGNEALVVEKLFEGPDRQLGVVRWEPDASVPGVGVRQIVVDLTVTGAARAGGGRPSEVLPSESPIARPRIVPSIRSRTAGAFDGGAGGLSKISDRRGRIRPLSKKLSRVFRFSVVISILRRIVLTRITTGVSD